MRVAFVGVKRPYRELDRDYVDAFNEFHLEIPWAYACHGGNDVTVTTVDMSSPCREFVSGGRFRNLTEDEFKLGTDGEYDVVVHWRKWFTEFYRSNSLNYVHTCDHSYDDNWVHEIHRAYESGQLYGLDCYPGWHQKNLYDELNGVVSSDRLMSGFTFGVDTSVYTPSASKDPRALLWSSDPGRGLNGAVQLAVQLFQKDKRFRLHVMHPDYVKHPKIQHPAIVWHGFVPNGPKLWNTFNESSFLPYTSTFKEPSSRAVRQAQSAGACVLYPPDRGSPSQYIRDDYDGYVRNIDSWEKLIVRAVECDSYLRLTRNARDTAVSESWNVQASRFNDKIGRIIQEIGQ